MICQGEVGSVLNSQKKTHTSFLQMSYGVSFVNFFIYKSPSCSRVLKGDNYGILSLCSQGYCELYLKTDVKAGVSLQRNLGLLKKMWPRWICHWFILIDLAHLLLIDYDMDENYNHGFRWDVITHPCLNLKGIQFRAWMDDYILLFAGCHYIFMPLTLYKFCLSFLKEAPVSLSSS